MKNGISSWELWKRVLISVPQAQISSGQIAEFSGICQNKLHRCWKVNPGKISFFHKNHTSAPKKNHGRGGKKEKSGQVWIYLYDLANLFWNYLCIIRALFKSNYLLNFIWTQILLLTRVMVLNSWNNNVIFIFKLIKRIANSYKW